MEQETVPQGLASAVTTLAGLFRGARRLIVPRYQRAYSWTNSEAGRLMEDLREAFQRDAPYYFVGTAVFIIEPGGERVVVDGQQRLATFTLVLAALRRRLEPALAERLTALIEHDDDVRLQLRPADRDFFAALVRDPEPATPEERRELPDPQARMLEAIGVIAEALADLDDRALAAFADFIVGRVTFNRIETTDRAGAPRLFLVLNETGGDLSAADLVKAELFERADLDDPRAEAAAGRWDELLNQMGRKGLDELLSFMPAITKGEVASGKDDALAPDLAVLRRGFLDHVDPAVFLQEGIYRYAEALLAIRRADVDAGVHSAEVNRRIRCLQLLRERDWLGAAVAYVAEHVGAPERLLPFFEGLERLAFACFLAIVPSHQRHARFGAVLRARNDPTALFGPGGALELTSAERRRMIARLNEPFRRDPNRRRIVALRFNAALPGGEALSITDDVTVEHILPANPDAAWTRGFPDELSRETLAHIAGNFALLTRAQNVICADRSFPEKRKVYFESKSAPIRALTRTLKETPDWTAAELRRRHEMLMVAICADWRLT